MNQSCRALGAEHLWGKWRKSTARGMKGRDVQVCQRCGARHYNLLVFRQSYLHASRDGRLGIPLCGADGGKTTKPKQEITCPECIVIITSLRKDFPSHAGFTHWGLTTAQLKRAAKDMVADMYGGADD